MCFSLLSGIPAWNPPRMGKNIFLITADLKLSRLPPRSPLPFAALPSVSLLPAAPLAHDTDKRKQEHDRTEYRFNHSAYPSVPSALSVVQLQLYWLLTTSCDAVLLNSTWSLTFWICAACSLRLAVRASIAFCWSALADCCCAIFASCSATVDFSRMIAASCS